MAYEYEIPAVNGKPLVEIPKELKDKVIDYTVLRDKIIIKASDLVDQLLYDTRVKVKDELGRLVKSITEYSYPPFANAVVTKDEDYVYAYKPANNFKGYILIDKGEAGVEDAKVIQKALDVGGKVFIAVGVYNINTPITLKDYVKIEGEGKEHTVLRATTSIDSVIKVDTAIRWSIRKLGIDGNNLATKAIDFYLLSSKPRKCVIEDVWFRRCQINIDLTNEEDATLRDVLLTEFTQCALKQDASGGINRGYHIKIHSWGVSPVNAIEHRGGLLSISDLTLELDADADASNANILLGDDAFLFLVNPFIVNKHVPAIKIENDITTPLVVVKGGYIGTIDVGASTPPDTIYSDTGVLRRLYTYGTYWFNNTDAYIINAEIEDAYIIAISGLAKIVTSRITRLHFIHPGYNFVVHMSNGKYLKKSGVATITGDGSSTTFTVDIDHGLVKDKVVAKITLDREGTVDKVYLVDKDGDGFKETLRVVVTYATAPADGEEVPIYWEAEVI